MDRADLALLRAGVNVAQAALERVLGEDRGGAGGRGTLAAVLESRTPDRVAPGLPSPG